MTFTEIHRREIRIHFIIKNEKKKVEAGDKSRTKLEIHARSLAIKKISTVTVLWSCTSILGGSYPEGVC